MAGVAREFVNTQVGPDGRRYKVGTVPAQDWDDVVARNVRVYGEPEDGDIPLWVDGKVVWGKPGTVSGDTTGGSTGGSTGGGTGGSTGGGTGGGTTGGGTGAVATSGALLAIHYSGSGYPARTTVTSDTTAPVIWFGPSLPPGLVSGVDYWFNTEGVS